jgi:uncharacterized protein (TIGR00299 family) protein
MTTVAFVDAPAGLAGDMLLGALVDAGLPAERLEEVVRALRLPDVRLEVRAVEKGPIAATKVDVLVDGHPADRVPGARDHDHPGHRHEHRTLADVVEILRAARGMPAEAVEDAVGAFEALAAAEGRVHGVPAEEVHFHEVGAVDALVDVLGTCVGLRDLGVTEVRVGPLPWSTGTVLAAHGVLPLPAPAVVYLLEGHPTFPSGETYEQVTPTGAALVRALSRGTCVPVGFVPRRSGFGAGTHPGGRLPNAVRLVVGEASEAGEAADCLLLESNLDDATGQEAARAIDRALEEGALDAWAAPVTMKKGRPGLVLSVLARPADAARLEALLFRETPTLGVRRRGVARTVLARRHVDVTTPWGPVRVKVREAPDGPEGAPEHDDCLGLAREHGVPLRRVVEAARRAYDRRA